MNKLLKYSSIGLLGAGVVGSSIALPVVFAAPSSNNFPAPIPLAHGGFARPWEMTSFEYAVKNWMKIGLIDDYGTMANIPTSTWLTPHSDLAVIRIKNSTKGYDGDYKIGSNQAFYQVDIRSGMHGVTLTGTNGNTKSIYLGWSGEDTSPTAQWDFTLDYPGKVVISQTVNKSASTEIIPDGSEWLIYNKPDKIIDFRYIGIDWSVNGTGYNSLKGILNRSQRALNNTDWNGWFSYRDHNENNSSKPNHYSPNPKYLDWKFRVGSINATDDMITDIYEDIGVVAIVTMNSSTKESHTIFAIDPNYNLGHVVINDNIRDLLHIFGYVKSHFNQLTGGTLGDTIIMRGNLLTFIPTDDSISRRFANADAKVVKTLVDHVGVYTQPFVVQSIRNNNNTYHIGDIYNGQNLSANNSRSVVNNDYVWSRPLVVDNQDDNYDYEADVVDAASNGVDSPFLYHYIRRNRSGGGDSGAKHAHWNKFATIKDPLAKGIKNIELKFTTMSVHQWVNGSGYNVSHWSNLLDNMSDLQGHKRTWDAERVRVNDAPNQSVNSTGVMREDHWTMNLQWNGSDWIYKSIKLGNKEVLNYYQKDNKHFNVWYFDQGMGGSGTTINETTPWVDVSFGTQQQLGIILKTNSWINGDEPHVAQDWINGTRSDFWKDGDIVLTMMPRYDNVGGEQGLSAGMYNLSYKGYDDNGILITV